jgi:hypothetical protein
MIVDTNSTWICCCSIEITDKLTNLLMERSAMSDEVSLDDLSGKGLLRGAA